MLPPFRRFFQDRNISHEVSMRDCQRFEDSCSDQFRALAGLPTSNSLLLTSVPLIGARGRAKAFSGMVGPSTCILSDVRDATLFQVGATYKAMPADGTWADVRPGSVTLSSINVVTGELTATTLWSSITGIAEGDFLWLEEDVGKYSLINHSLNRVPNGFVIVSTDHGPATVWRSPHELNDSSGSPIVGSTDFRREAVSMRVRSNRYCKANILVL
jgi:hypothetical protein